MGLAKVERPNILWITSEDNNVNWVSCYGNEWSRHPILIDWLGGFRYSEVYANAPVCAPSRCVDYGYVCGHNGHATDAES